jgi:hypothetical protein
MSVALGMATIAATSSTISRGDERDRLFREHNEMVVVGDPSDQNPFGGRLKDQRLMMWSFGVMRRFKRIKENFAAPRRGHRKFLDKPRSQSS